MFDLTRMDEAEQSLRALVNGAAQQMPVTPRPAAQTPARQAAQCPYHRQDVAA